MLLCPFTYAMKSGIGTAQTGEGSAIIIGIGTSMEYVLVTGIAIKTVKS